MTVNPTPVLTSALNPAAICSGTAFSYTPTGSVAGTSFAWTRAVVAGISNLVGAGTGNPNETLLNTTGAAISVAYIYTLSANGCTNPSTFTVNVTVNPFPTLTSSLTPPSICSGSLFNYTPTSLAGGTVFSWTRAVVAGISNASGSGTGNPGETLVNTTSSPVTVTYAYSLSANGCSNPSIYNVQVIVNPAMTLSSTLTPAAICSGSVFSYVPTSPTPGVTFNWTRALVAGISNAAGLGTNNPNETLFNTTASPVSVTYIYSLSLSGCTNTYNVVVVVNPTPVLTSTLTPSSICSNTVFNYTPTSSTAGAVFSWSRVAVAGISNAVAGGTGNPGETLINTSALPVTVTYLYSLLANGCSGAVNSVQVVVNPSATLSSTLTPPSICSGTNFVYTATSATAGVTITWNRALVAGISNAAASGSGNISETLVNTTALPVSVTYVYTLGAGGCNNTQNVVVTVNPTPVLTSALNPAAICSGTAFSYTPTGSVVGTSFAWTRAVVAGISNPVGAGTGNPNETLTNTTSLPVVVTYVYTLSVNGCTNPSTYSVNVTVNPFPTLTSTLSPTAVCSGTVFSYTPTSLAVGTIFSWTRAVVAGISNASGSGSGNPNETLINTTTSPITVTYAYTVSAGGCSNPSIYNVKVVVNPAMTLSSTLTPPAICSGTLFSYTPTSPSPGVTFNWSRLALAGISNAPSGGVGNPNEVLTNISAVPVVVTYVYSLSAGGCTNTYNVVVTVNPVPALSSSLAPPSICSNSVLSYVPTSLTPGTVFSWSRTAVAGISNASATGTSNPNETLINTTAAPVSVSYIYTLTANGCSNPATFTVVVTVNPGPSLTSSLTPAAVCSGTQFNYTPTSSFAGATMTWSRSSVPGIVQTASSGSGNINEFLTNSTASPVNVIYQYTLVANGCTNVQNVVVAVNPSPVLSSNLALPALCSGSVLHYVATSATAGTVFNWSRNAIPGILEPAVPVAVGDVNETLTNTTNAPIVVTYHYTLVANGCTGNSYDVTVTVNPTPPIPVITPAGPVSFCSGGNLILSAPSGYSSYLWSNGASTQNITVTTAGSYSVVVKDGNGCQSASSLPVVVSILPSATTYAGADGIICAGNNFPITGATASNYSSFAWSTSGSGTFNNSTTLLPTYLPSAADITAGAVTITLTAYSIAPCATIVHDDLILTIKTSPTVDAGLDKKVCYPAGILINGTATNFQNPSWTHNGAGTLTGNNTLSPTYHPVAADVGNTVKLTLSVDALAPCATTVSDFMFIQVDALPGNPGVISGPVGSRCKGTSATYSVLPIATATSYNWSLPAGISITSGANTNTINVLFGPGAVSGNITIFGSNGCGNGVVSTLPVVVSDIPANPGSIAGKTSICQGATGEVFSITVMPGATAYNWTVPTGATITSAAPQTNTITVDFGPGSVSGDVTVNVTNSCGVGPTSTKTIQLNIKPSPAVITASGSPTTFCEGGSVLLSGATLGFNYLWSPGGVTTQNYQVTTSGNYSVVITDPVTGCSSIPSNVIPVTVNPAPAPPVSTGFITQCWNGSGAVPILNANTNATVPAGKTITWYNALTGGVVVPFPTLNVVGTVTYYAEVKDNVTGCLSLLRTPVVLTISQNPAAPTAGLDQTACEQSPNQTLTATATAPAGTSLLWYTAPTGGIPVSPVLSNVGTATFYAEATNGTCSSLTRSAGVTLTIIGAPAAPVSGGDITECIVVPVAQTLTATATAPAGSTVKWWTAASGGSSVASPTRSTLGTSIYYAESINTLTSCASLTRTPVTLSLVLHPAAPVADPDIIECEKSPLQVLTATAKVPTGSTIKWYTTAAGGAPVTPTLNHVGNVVYYAETDNGLCQSLTRVPVSLTINPAPAPPVSLGDITACENKPAIQTLTALASPAGSLWYTTPAGGSSVSPTLNQVGSATYYAESKLGNCVSLTRSAPVILTIKATPDKPVSTGDVEECEKSPMQTLTATAIAPAGSTVKWYTAATGGVSVATPTLNSVGTISYWAESDNGNCHSVDRAQVTLTIDPAPAPPVSLGNITQCEQNPFVGLTAAVSAPGASTVVWYTSATGGVSVPTHSLNEVGTITYYAESRFGNCASTKRSAPIILTINGAPAAPTPDNPTAGDPTKGEILACATNPVQTLTATVTPPPGATVRWYTTATGGIPIAKATLSAIGEITYYAESYSGTCSSFKRTPVFLKIAAVPSAPVSNGNITACAETPIQTLIALATVPSGTSIRWYNTLAGGTPVSETLNQIGTATYYAEAYTLADPKIGECVSLTRSKPVVLTINPIPANPVPDNPKPGSPTEGEVIACATSPLQTLVATVTVETGATVKWYDRAVGGNLVTSPTLTKITSVTYYAEAILGTCKSAARTPVTLTILALPNKPILAGPDNVTACESLTPMNGDDAMLPVPGVTLQWYDAVLNGTAVSPVMDYVGTRLIYAAAVGSNGCESSARTRLKQTVIGAPAAPVSTGDIKQCTINPIQTLDANKAIAPAAGLTINWYTSATGGTPMATAPTFNTPNDSITYYASYTDKTTGCESLKRTAVKLKLTFATASAASNGPLALGQTLLLKGGPDVPGNTFLWTDPNGFVFSTIDVTIPNVTAAAAGKYILSVTSTNGCTANDTIDVVLDIAQADAQRNTCIGSTLYLSGLPDNMKSYNWTGPNGFTSADQNPSIDHVSIVNAGTYTLTVTNANNATSSDTVNVAFKPLPIPTPSYSTVCPSGNLQLKGGPNGMTSYTWTDQNGSNWLQQNPLPIPFPNPAETFKLTVVDWNGCEASKTITPVPFQPVASSNSPLCTGDTLRLRGEPNGMASYRWTGPNSYVSTLQSPNLNNVTAATASGDYVLTVVDKTGCTYSTKTTVTFNTPAPIPTILPNMNPICEGNTLFLTGGPDGMGHYDWTGPNGFISALQNPQIGSIGRADAGNYTLKLTTPLGCKSSFTTNIAVSTVTFNGSYGPYCINDSPVTISVTPTGGSLSGPGVNGNIFDPKAAGAGRHAIQYIYTGPSGCTINATMYIDVVTAPLLVITNPVLPSCTGTVTDLTAPAVTFGSTPGLLLSYWIDAKASQALGSPRGVPAGLYYIKGTTPSGKCFSVLPVKVQQPDSLRALITTKSTDCYGDSTGTMDVNVTLGTAPFTYAWNTTPPQSASKAINLRAGVYSVVVTDAKMCTVTFVDTVKEAKSVKAYFTKTNVNCVTDENGSARVDSINGSGLPADLNAYTYSWNTVPPQLTRQAVKLKYGSHIVTLTNSKGCANRDSVYIDVLDIIPPTIQCPKDLDLIVHATKAADGSPNTIVVDLGKPVVSDNCNVIKVTNDAPDKFRFGETIVTWTVTDAVGLIDTCHQVVNIREFPTIPQLLSPNGDGINDTFVIEGIKGFDKSQLLIFTRSGQLVYQSNDYQNDWDGRYGASTFSHNKLVAPGVYYYILTLAMPGGQKQKIQGYVYVYY